MTRANLPRKSDLSCHFRATLHIQNQLLQDVADNLVLYYNYLIPLSQYVVM